MSKNQMKKFYITFGQNHAHAIAGNTFDKDCVAEIYAKSYHTARAIAFETFGDKWSFAYDNLKDLEVEKYFPRGVIILE